MACDAFVLRPCGWAANLVFQHKEFDFKFEEILYEFSIPEDSGQPYNQSGFKKNQNIEVNVFLSFSGLRLLRQRRLRSTRRSRRRRLCRRPTNRLRLVHLIVVAGVAIVFKSFDRYCIWCATCFFPNAV